MEDTSKCVQSVIVAITAGHATNAAADRRLKSRASQISIPYTECNHKFVLFPELVHAFNGDMLPCYAQQIVDLQAHQQALTQQKIHGAELSYSFLNIKYL